MHLTNKEQQVIDTSVPFSYKKNSEERGQHMMDEIKYAPNALLNLCTWFESENATKTLSKLRTWDFDKIYIIGCGTAYHSGLVGEKYFEKHLNIPTSTFVASEFNYNPPHLDRKTLCIFVSQSGETADTLLSINMCKRKKCKCVAITNQPNSTMSKIADLVFPISAGIEIAVASTKAYTNQCALFYILSKSLKSRNPLSHIRAISEIKKISKQIKNSILNSKNIQNLLDIALKVAKSKDVLFIGRHFDYITALEASLKLKETCYINCSSLPAGEIKHGPLALMEKGFCVLGFSTAAKIHEKTLHSLAQAKTRDALTIAISPYQSNDTLAISIPKTSSDLAPIVSIVPIWLICYFVSLQKDLNPDSPRNLTKSVMVE